jgi:hypothetical protein
VIIEGFSEIFNIIYIAKKLFDLGKYDLVTESFFDVLDYDTYYEGALELIQNLFEYHHCGYYDTKNLELHVISDPVIVDFYTLAGEYGKLFNLADDANPFINNAKDEVSRQLSFSYCLDWMVMGHTEPKRPFHSRIGLFISHDDFLDAGCLAYALVEICEWYSEGCDILRKKLQCHKRLKRKNTRRAAIAA